MSRVLRGLSPEVVMDGRRPQTQSISVLIELIDLLFAAWPRDWFKGYWKTAGAQISGVGSLDILFLDVPQGLHSCEEKLPPFFPVKQEQSAFLWQLIVLAIEAHMCKKKYSLSTV